MNCVFCGCSEFDPCIEPGGMTCAWITEEPPICSSCAARGPALLADNRPETPEASANYLAAVRVLEILNGPTSPFSTDRPESMSTGSW